MDEQKVNEDSLDGKEPEHAQEPVADGIDTITAPASVAEQSQANPVAPVAPPETPQPVTTPTNEKPKSGKPKWFLPAIFAGLLVLGGGAAAYLTVFQSTPEKAWKSALSNTADGLDKYLTNTYNSQNKGFKVDGSFDVSSPIAIDGSVKGQWYESDGEMTADFGAGGARFTAEVKTITPEGSTTPDIYAKVDGLEGIDSLLGSFGATDVQGYGEMLSSLNNQWFFIDHTLIDQATATQDSSSLEFSEDDMKKVTNNVSAVLRDRMFTTEQDKAIFTIAEKLGKEDFGGTSTQKIRVAVDKENFKEFVTALKDSIKDTKLEDLVKANQEDKTLEEALEFEDLLKELDDADFSNITADVWVEANGGYVRNVRIYPMADKKDSNYLDFGMKYTGGDLFPLEMKATVDDDGSKGTLTLGLQVNQSNGDAKFSFDLDMTIDGGDIKANGELSVSGSNEDTDVDKPLDAKNIFELLGGFGGALTDTYELGTDPSIYDSTLYDVDPSIYDDFEL